MTAVDYSAAWDDLQALISSRDGWGSRTLLAEMAELRLRHRIPEPEVARALSLAARAASGELTVYPPRSVPLGGPVEGSEEDRDEQREHAGPLIPRQ